MNNKKGISLIVLVITILVMIILAGVVIVSLQNDNPINKAKFAKMVDSVQSVRGAISQYAVTAQANSEGAQGSVIDAILAQTEAMANDTTSGKGTLSGTEGYLITDVKYKNNEKTIKELLGVDPSQVKEYGYFLVNRTSGASKFVIKPDKLAGLGIIESTVLPDGISRN